MIPALQEFSPYSWCQITRAFAIELHRAKTQDRSGKPLGAWALRSEADACSRALRQGWGDGAAFGLGARPGEVVWLDVGCFAANYALLPPSERDVSRELMARGELGPSTLGPAAYARCPLSALEDPEYRGFGPQCQWSPGAWVLIGLGAVAVGGIAAHMALARTR